MTKITLEHLAEKMDNMATRLDMVETRLSKRVDDIDIKLTNRIDEVDKKLTKQIDQLDVKLTNKIDEDIDHLAILINQSFQGFDSRFMTRLEAVEEKVG